MIELRGVRVEYRQRAVVRDARLSIAAGERVALIGPNGAGKSTLLRVLTGLFRPAAGEAVLGGEADALVVHREHVSWRAALGAAVAVAGVAILMWA